MLKNVTRGRNHLKTISVEDETVVAFIKVLPVTVVNKYKSFGITISDLQTLGRNTFAYFAKFPPTEEQIEQFAPAAATNDTLIAFFENIKKEIKK